MTQPTTYTVTWEFEYIEDGVDKRGFDHIEFCHIDAYSAAFDLYDKLLKESLHPQVFRFDRGEYTEVSPNIKAYHRLAKRPLEQYTYTSGRKLSFD